jgi:peptide/nickel transport system substrate-binding protein
LRVGVAQLSATNPTSGLRQLAQNLAVESLARLDEDGRLQPGLAESWALGPDGKSLLVAIKSGVTFHDGSPLNPTTVAALLPDALRTTMGPVISDVDFVRVANENSIVIGFRHPSPFLLEALEVQIRKPGSAIVATGPYMIAPDSMTEFRANPNYYMGRPQIERVRIATYPAVRTAWAEMLRNRLDMLYEVGSDALDSLESSSNVSVFTFTRRYQYMLFLNTKTGALRPAAIRRALNSAVDRRKLVQDALNGHGLPSSSPIWPRYWALPENLPPVPFDPQGAASTLGNNTTRNQSSIQFTCLVAPDSIDERIALELKRQFQAVGIDMEVQAADRDAILEAERLGKYEAILGEGISGQTLLRPYQLWHSDGSVNPGTLGNPTVDAAFDRLRAAETEAAFRTAVVDLQKAFVDDPPAVFLAWSERARAVTKRFTVPSPERGRDILGTLRLWTPHNDERIANRN